MDEYIEREAVLKVLRGKAVAKYPSTYYMGLFAAANEVSKIPAADVVEVVRCKDCVYWCGDRRYSYCRQVDALTDPSENDFCSYGERMDSDV